MKNKCTYLSLLLTLCITIAGCGTKNNSKNEATILSDTIAKNNDSIPKNYIQLNGQKFRLHVIYDSNNEYNTLKMPIVANGNNVLDMLQIYMYSHPISDKLKKGTYTFHDDDDKYNPQKHFYDIDIGIYGRKYYRDGKITIENADNAGDGCFKIDFDFLFVGSPKDENPNTTDSLFVNGHYEGFITVNVNKGQPEEYVEYGANDDELDWKYLTDDHTLKIPDNYIVISGVNFKDITLCTVDTISDPNYCQLEFYEQYDFKNWNYSDTRWTYDGTNVHLIIRFRKQSQRRALPIGTFKMKVDYWGWKRNKKFNAAKHFADAWYGADNYIHYFDGGTVTITDNQTTNDEYEIKFVLFEKGVRTEGYYNGGVLILNPFAESESDLLTPMVISMLIADSTKVNM